MPARVPDTQNGHSNNFTEDIVITGISGRLPESNNIEEFKQHLLDYDDMVTDDDRRWPGGLHGLPTRTGKIKDLQYFDNTFFGVHAKQADVMDPQLRLLLEVTQEAIIDAGINPTDLKGSKTGVFVGVSSSESEEYWTLDPDIVTGYALTGCCRAMFPNRISYTFDLQGPSYAIDTACSSSMFALQQAVNAIQTGQCDAAIVGGVNLVLKPTSSLQFHRLGMLSPEGQCKTFDSSGNGYVRSEAAVVIVIQKAGDALRSYASILGAKTNTDGNKEQGITFPSGDMQQKLVREVYADAGIDPADVAYIEAHGTGTKVGDPQEVNSIASVFCKNRNGPVLIGSVKSNMGHTEPASGLCAIAKVLIAMEQGVIPANLHYANPNTDIPALSDGRLKVVAKHEPWNGGMAAINSFGFGGANAHVILKSNPKPKVTWPAGPIPRLIAVSGRTEEAVNNFMTKIKGYENDEELFGLINHIHRTNVTGHGYRGYSIIGSDVSEVSQVLGPKRPVWFVFSGMGSQWPGMAKDLMRLEPFRNSIKRCSDALKPHGINLEDILINSNESTFDDVRNSFVSIAAIQVALVDLLKLLGVEPDGILGHSVGEVGCAYADGTLTPEQAILCAYSRGTAILETELAAGSMAAVGLSWDECKRRCPADIFPACHNSEDSVTISGAAGPMEKFVAQLTSEDIFAKLVKSSGVAFHSKYIAEAGPKLKKYLDEIIPSPKARSSKWISTSIPEAAWNTPLAQQSSASYHVNNLLSPVYFCAGMKHIPENAIVIEIAPHALLQAILKRALGPNATNIGLVKRGHADNVQFLLSNIGKIFNAGAQPNIGSLYHPVTFPVGRGTPMIAPMVEWDHSTEWAVANFANKGARSGELVVDIDMSKEEFSYLSGHTIDGRVLFPATGYLTLVWKTFAKLRNEDFEQMPVIIEDVKFMRATIMPKEGSTKFLINIFEGSGDFEICVSGSVVVSGKIYVPEEIDTEFLTLDKPVVKSMTDVLPLGKADIYKELRLRGYDYEGIFRGIDESDSFGCQGKLNWDKNWISFIDTMLQFSILGQEIRELYLPTALQKVIINPKMHLEAADKQIPVYRYADIGIIKSGGIELRGMKASLAPRRLVQAAPKMEKYLFTPLHNTTPTNEDNEKSKIQVLTIASQIVLENSAGSVKLKVVEAAMDKSVEALLLPKIQEILESEPLMSVNGVVVSMVPMDATVLEEKDITLLKKDATSVIFESNAHMVVMTDILAHKQQSVLHNAVASLKEGGFILLEEPQGATVNAQILASEGLEAIYQQASANRMYMLLRKPVEVETNSIVLNITENNFNWIEPIQKALKASETDGTRVYLVCQGEELTGMVGLMNCLKHEPGGVNFRSIFIQDKNAEAFSIKSNYYLNQLSKDLVQNVLKNGIWGTFRHVLLEQVSDAGKLQVEHAYINTLTRGDLASLKWIEGPLTYYKDEDPSTEMCSVYYAPLNFRDIMLATGKLPPDALPGNLAGQDCILGLEFSGRDTKGRRVMGMVAARSMATSVLADPGFLWEVPEKWSLEEAATIPVVYGTSYYALIVRGRMQPGESVLIHAGSGGVGQASIAIALHMGCEVFTTVSSQAKRDFLKKNFPKLKDENIGNSRDTSFEQMVLRKTSGRGVDLVLNSLAAQQLQASIRCLAIGGRFLEIGKVDLSHDSPLGMRIFLKNITFHGILLDCLFDSVSSDKKEVMRLVTEGIANGAVRPLPSTVYAENQIEQAFRFMASGKHIGKVLLKVREEESRKAQQPNFKTVTAIPRTYMDPEKVYVLVGGLGGFGLELTNWLITRGAKKIVLTSRSGIKTGYQSLCIRRWRNQNVKVHISRSDAVTEKGARTIMEESNKLGPIGGIFNLAAVLKDAMMKNQTEADFKAVCRPKIDATKHLDATSRLLAPHLDYFVIFSSVSCGRGNIGQANYGLANSAMERIVEARQIAGLPGVAIQWGAIGDVGLVLEFMGGNDTEVLGTLPQRITSCMATMDIFLQQPNPVVGSMVLAEKRKGNRDANQLNLTSAVGNILGIKDVKTIAPTSTLADLGMDSLMGAEIKQTLERNYDVLLSAKEIRNLSFGMLIDLESGASSVEASSNKTVNDDKQVQFDDQLMPDKSMIKMTSKETGTNKNPVFILHAIEGVVTALKELVSEIQAPVYGLQCTSDAPLGSISELAKYYIGQMKSVQGKGPYTVLGYSFGACVAFEIGIQLEAMKEKVTLFLIDGSHSYVATHTGKSKTQMISKGDVVQEQSEALVYFMHQFTELDQQKAVRELMSLKTWEDRLQKTTQILLEVTPFPANQIAAAASSFYYKLVAGDKYKPTSQFKGKLVLVKASDNYVQLGDDYGLGSVCKQKVNVHTLEGNHRSILANPTLVKLANASYQDA